MQRVHMLYVVKETGEEILICMAESAKLAESAKQHVRDNIQQYPGLWCDAGWDFEVRQVQLNTILVTPTWQKESDSTYEIPSSSFLTTLTDES